jgi:5-hydroxyisourate hydrolase
MVDTRAMAGHLSTHVLDTVHGCPAAGMEVTLSRLDADAAAPQESVVVGQWTLNADGRTDGGPILADAAMIQGRYRLAFAVGDYFRKRGVKLADPPFLDVVVIDFGIADPAARYHVPLLATPWSYSTYRGS